MPVANVVGVTRRLCLWLALLLCVGPSRAQQAHSGDSPLRVATRIVPPFVMRDQSGALTGFSVELWRAIERDTGLRTRWVETGTVRELLQSVAERGADVGVAAVSITSERDRRFDFSQPIYDAGLQIMVRAESVKSGGTLQSLWAQVSQPPLRNLIVLMFLSTLVMAHLLWLIERRREDGIVEDASYRRGMSKALWWSAGTLGAQADEMPRSPLGRLLAVAWMFLSIIFIAFFTATITTTLTVERLQGNINGPNDLPGKRVATVAGSTSATYLRGRGLKASEFAQVSGAIRALEAKRVEAVVFDAPILQYYAAHEGRERVHVVGPVFRRENYGIVFLPGLRERKRINTALLRLKENGTYDQLTQKYFGTNDQSGNEAPG